jgi:hypothetical protein
MGVRAAPRRTGGKSVSLLKGLIAPMSSLARNFAGMRFSSQVLKVAVMATVDVTVETDIEKIRQAGTAAGVVPLRSVAGGAATLASAALWNRTRKIKPLPVVRACASVMTEPVADPACSLRRSGRAEELSCAPNGEDGDSRSQEQLPERDGLLRRLSVCPVRLHNDS